MMLREPEALLNSGLAVIDRAFRVSGALSMLPLFSGGHDSLCACFVASKHEFFAGEVRHIRTGIGAAANWEFVYDTCRDLDWKLIVHKSPATYERFVSRLGFPGPGSHQWVYNWLKDRCISQMTKGRGRVVLLTGCREQESTRRMGHVEAVKIGETSKRMGKVQKKHRVWTAPCFDWSSEEQHLFMQYFDLPRNPVKDSPLAMSGECFCGAFARPGEIELIRRYAPDVAAEIDRLSEIAIANGKHAVWGTRPDGKKGTVIVETGPLCQSCDYRASAAGIQFGEVTRRALDGE